MPQIHNIRKLYFDEGKNISEISIKTGTDRKTIRNYIKKKNWNRKVKIKSEPFFHKLEPYKELIDKWLIDDKKAKKKQRHTAKRVYDRLLETYPGSFKCSYRTVANYFKMKRKKIYGNKPGYIPLDHIPGEAQVDFGDAQYYENGKLYNGKYLNVSFPYSNMGYFQLFKGENQECLFEGLISIFIYIGGIPQLLWFDNTSTIVTKILQNGERNLTDAFLRFMAHYRFESSFCNANAGHEKGSVEGKVGYHRRNMLVPVPRFENLEAFNKELLEKCDKDSQREHYRKNSTIEELFIEDKNALLSLPNTAFDASKYVKVKTNNYGKFYLNNGLHEYSVSPKYAGESLVVKLTANEVIPMDESLRSIVRHERFYGSLKQQSMKWLPYLTQLSRRPGALKYTGIFKILPESMQEYLDNCNKSNKGKVLQMIAFLTEKNGFDSAVMTVEDALKYEAKDSDSLLNLHKRIHNNIIDLPAIKLPGNIPNLVPVNMNLNAYDQSLGNRGGGNDDS